MAVFSFATVFTAAIAWFALNKQADVNGVVVSTITDSASFSKVTVHKRFISECTSENYVFNVTPEVTGTITTTGQVSGLYGQKIGVSLETNSTSMGITVESGYSLYIEGNSICNWFNLPK